MVKIKDVERFVSSIEILASKCKTGLLKTIDEKNYMFSFDGIVLIRILFPDLTNEYDLPINLKQFNETVSKFCKKDKVDIDIQEDLIKVVIDGNIKKRYQFNNSSFINMDKTITSQVFKILPLNKITVSSDIFYESISSLAFKTKDKYLQKIKINIEDRQFILRDCSPFKIGTSKITVPMLSSDIKEDCEVKINWCVIKDIISTIPKITDEINLKLETGFPIKIYASSEDYEIIVLIAPLIENDE